MNESYFLINCDVFAWFALLAGKRLLASVAQRFRYRGESRPMAGAAAPRRPKALHPPAVFFFSKNTKAGVRIRTLVCEKKKHSTALGGRAEGGGVFCDKIIFIANPVFFFIYSLLLAYLDVAVEVSSCSSYVTTILAGFYETGVEGGVVMKKCAYKFIYELCFQILHMFIFIEI